MRLKSECWLVGGLNLAPLQQQVLAYNARTDPLPASLRIEAPIVFRSVTRTDQQRSTLPYVDEQTHVATAADDQSSRHSSFAPTHIKAGSAGWISMLLTCQAGNGKAQIDRQTNSV